MKAVVKSISAPGYQMSTVPEPEPEYGEVLVRIEQAAICGTDLHIVNWDKWAASRIVPPLIFGHEFVGRVTKTGPGVESVEAGDLVTAETHLSCRTCFHCRTGQTHLCPNGKVIGIDSAGAFAEFIVFPAENAWKIDRDMRPDIGALLNPLGNAVYAVLSAEVPGNSVVVIGCGPIGLFSIMTARVSGASAVIAVDINDYRLGLARDAGAALTINPRNSDPVSAIRQLTSGIGADLVIEVSGNPAGIEIAFAVARDGGSLRLVGIPENPVTLDLANRIIFRELNIKGISGREIFRTYYQITGLIRAGMDPVAMFTHRFPFADFDQAMQLMHSGKCGKILLEFG